VLAIRTQSKIVNKQKIVNNCLGPRAFTISGGSTVDANAKVAIDKPDLVEPKIDALIEK
jgi:hypothetical protein